MEDLEEGQLKTVYMLLKNSKQIPKLDFVVLHLYEYCVSMSWKKCGLILHCEKDSNNQLWRFKKKPQSYPNFGPFMCLLESKEMTLKLGLL